MLRTQLDDELTDICKGVLQMNNAIKYVAIINEKGRVEESQTRDCIIDKLDPTKKEMYHMENALRHRIRKEFDEELGEEQFTYVERKKNGMLSVPMDKNLLLVSFKTRQIKFSPLVKNIIRLIHKYKKKSNNQIPSSTKYLNILN